MITDNWYEEKIFKTANSILLKIGKKRFNNGRLGLALVLAKELDIQKNNNFECEIYKKLIEEFFDEVMVDGEDFDPYSKEYEKRMQEKFWVVSKYLRQNYNFVIIIPNKYRTIGIFLGVIISLLLYLFGLSEFIGTILIFCIFVALGISLDIILYKFFASPSYDALHSIEN